MKSIQIVFINNGENCGTYSPLCFLNSFPADKDINEKCERFISWDCNIYTSTDLYRVRVENLPDWMTEDYYLQNHIDWKFAHAQAPDFCDQLTQDQFNKFKGLGEKYQYFIGSYFEGKTKNPFKISIRAQIMEWINAPYDYKRPQPLSPRQFEAATKYTPLYNAGRISSRVYNSY